MAVAAVLATAGAGPAPDDDATVEAPPTATRSGPLRVFRTDGAVVARSGESLAARAGTRPDGPSPTAGPPPAAVFVHRGPHCLIARTQDVTVIAEFARCPAPAPPAEQPSPTPPGTTGREARTAREASPPAHAASRTIRRTGPGRAPLSRHRPCRPCRTSCPRHAPLPPDMPRASPLRAYHPVATKPSHGGTSLVTMTLLLVAPAVLAAASPRPGGGRSR
ncbi:hypothetical protein GCM10020000_10950 [Streptomyces olivoverticillatus]